MNGLREDKLDQLLQMAGPEVARDLLQRLTGFRTAELAQLDAAEAERRLHRLNSDAGWVGAGALQQRAEELEMLVVRGHFEQLGPRLADLEASLAQVLPSLQKALEGLNC